MYIIGAGCVGSVLAEHMYGLSDVDLKFIAKGRYAEQLIEKGVTVNGRNCRVPVAMAGDDVADLVVVCVKNFNLETACDDMSPFVDGHTIILPLLNSVSPTPTIKELLPESNHVLYGYINKIDSMKVGDEYRYNIAGDIHFGYASNSEVAPELVEIQEMLVKAGFNAYIDKDMLRGVWRKWMLNVGANQVSALTEANYLQFGKIPEIKEVLRLAMQELLTISGYEGVDLGNRDIAELLDYLTTYPYPNQTSMLQDILAKRKTEVDYISGDIIRLSHKWNCPCPVNLTMYYLIKSKQESYLSAN